MVKRKEDGEICNMKTHIIETCIDIYDRDFVLLMDQLGVDTLYENVVLKDVLTFLGGS